MEPTHPYCLVVWHLLVMMILVNTQLENDPKTATPGRNIRNLVIQELNTSALRLALDNRNGNILVGGANRIYRLSNDDLSIIDEVQTGPVNDSRLCRPYPEQCEFERNLAYNYNQILLINYHAKPKPNLLACGTTNQGMCHVHNLDALNRSRLIGSTNLTTNYITNRSFSKGTVAFFAPGSPDTMFIANSNDERRPIAFSVPTVSKRLVETGEVGFQYVRHNNYTAAIDFPFNLKWNIDFEYLYGFVHGDYAYFVKTRSSRRSTRLARVCLNDVSFYSYTELLIDCKGVGNQKLVHATAAVLAKVGPKQYRATGTSNNSNSALFVAFSYKRGSAICAFAMDKIEVEFERLVKECFSCLWPASLLKSFHGELNACTKANFSKVDLCGSAINRYIGGSRRFRGVYFTSVVTVEDVSALAITIQGNETVAVIGAGSGLLYKSIISGPLFSMSFAKPKIYSGIQPNPVLAADHAYLYFATGDQVVKFPLRSCSIYTDCNSCLTTNDPLNCGWCGTFCAHSDECDEQITTTCTPQIYSITPSKGPIGGGTELTISGSDFGMESQENKSRITITAAGIICEISKWESRQVKCITEASQLEDITGNLTSRFRERTGIVKVSVTDVSRHFGNFNITGDIISTDTYAFVEPNLESISPTFGPESGGTRLLLTGSNLDVGKTRTILVNNNTCKEVENYGLNLTCLTGSFVKGHSVYRGGVTMEIDGYIVPLPAIKPTFTYKPDSVITGFEPKSTILSGGTNIVVSGLNLDSVYDPKMVVQFVLHTPLERPENKTSSCEVLSGTSMRCTTPKLTEDIGMPPGELKLIAFVSFEMDGVPYVIPENYKLTCINYYTDPMFSSFDKNLQHVLFDHPVIALQGKDLSTEYNIHVQVGGDIKCIIQPQTELNLLFCELDFNANPPDKTARLPVKVTVGSLNFDLGSIDFIYEPADSSINIMIWLSGFVVIFIITAACTFFIMKKRGYFTSKPTPTYGVAFEHDQPESDSQPCELNDNPMMTLNLYVDDPLLAPGNSYFMEEETLNILSGEGKLISIDCLTIGEVLGKGHFGSVYKASLELPGQDTKVDVAVKTLQSRWLSYEDMDNFIREAVIMKDFDHEHVLNLIGVCFNPVDQSPYIVIPIMPKGDLLSYIRNVANELTVEDLIIFGIEIARGMEYLASQKFVHRDLAARNCMLDNNLHVRVADFGLSRDIYERDYYKSDKQTELPVKWMAPESIEKNVYNMKTDVWAFGVTMWELMTRGVTPYSLVNNYDIMSYLSSGRRLLRPECCPETLYQLICTCWKFDPTERRSFSDLVRDVQFVKTSLEVEAESHRVDLEMIYADTL